MNSIYRLTGEAEVDLLDIWLYIASDNQTAADRVLDRIYATLERIAEMPGIGHLREDLTAAPDLRFFSVYSYVIIYRRNSAPLEIVRILSGYRDIPRLLR